MIIAAAIKVQEACENVTTRRPPEPPPFRLSPLRPPGPNANKDRNTFSVTHPNLQSVTRSQADWRTGGLVRGGLLWVCVCVCVCPVNTTDIEERIWDVLRNAPVSGFQEAVYQLLPTVGAPCGRRCEGRGFSRLSGEQVAVVLKSEVRVFSSVDDMTRAHVNQTHTSAPVLD